MGIRDIKVHYKREWQAITDVDVWHYRYSSLIKDIMKNFLPRGAAVPNFKITCEMYGEFINIFDDNSLRRCLLFGESEIDMYVEIQNDIGDCSRTRTISDLGYFVEEVEDEEQPEVVVLDSDSGDDIEQSSYETAENSEDINHVYGVHETEDEVDDEFEYEVDDEIEDEDEGVDEESEGILSDGVECEFTTDDEEEYRDVEDNHSDSMTSLEEEFDNNMNVSDDELSNVESDEVRFDHILDDSNGDEEVEKMRKLYAGTWFKKNQDGSIEFKVGQLFNNVYHFRAVLRDFVIQEGFELVRHKNEKSRVTVSCSGDGCSWRLHASPTPDGTTYKIKTYKAEHNCLRKSTFKDATSAWIANNLIHKFAAEPNKSKRGIEQDLIDEFGITGLSTMKLFRARQKAKIMLHGDAKEQYAKLRSYGELVLHHNPGSVFKVTTCERQSFCMPPMFKRVFMIFDGVRRGFQEGCRPFFGLDGCFLKGSYGGMMLAAVALDGNSGVLPLAVCIAESECRDSWMWFLELLKDTLGSDFDGIPWTNTRQHQELTKQPDHQGLNKHRWQQGIAKQRIHQGLLKHK